MMMMQSRNGRVAALVAARLLRIMIPPRSVLALVLAFSVGGRLGEPFRVQNICLTRRWIGIDTLSLKRRTCGYPVSRALPRSMRITTALTQGQPRYTGSNNRQGGSLVKIRATESAEATGSEDVESEADRLHREVFSNEKGFLASAAYNPARAREKEEEEEAERLASEWGSTPDMAKDVIAKTRGDKDLSFQELEKMARGLNLSDEQQRAFMLKASMKKLSSATTLPKRKQKTPAQEAVDNRVFASEKGFLKNSKEFKNRMKVGSGVRFDAEGFPVGGEGDPMVAATRKPKPSTESMIEGVSFPSLPDCPRCSAPTMEDELSQFGMCSQCKANEISAVAYSGPAVASKYTYDNGDAPFSSSWTTPTPTKGRGAPPDKPDPKSSTATRRRNAAATAGAAAAVATSAAANVGAAIGGGGGGGGGAAAAAAATTAGAASGATGGGGGGGGGDTYGDRVSGRESSEAVRKLSLEVAELRSLVGATRAALRKRGTEQPGAVGTMASAAPAAAAEAAASAKDEQRDAAVRKLARDVAELRADLASVAARDGAVGAREGGTEAVQRLSREVTELRSQLEQSRKEHAMTRTALRRLKDGVDGLVERDAHR